MDKHYIYITTNLINGKQYIGQRKTPINKTPENDSYLGSGVLLLKAIKKYGRKNFKKEIIATCNNNIEADRLECFYLDKYDALNKKDQFYNRGLGGQYWRPNGHSDFMSTVMKDFYKNTHNKEKFLRGSGLIKENETINDYIKKKDLKKLNGLRVHLINTLKWIKNIKHKQENPFSITKCGNSSNKTKLEWQDPIIRKKRIDKMKVSTQKRWDEKNKDKYKIINGVMFKKCNKCNDWLELSKYHQNIRCTDRKQSICPKCKNTLKQKRVSLKKELIKQDYLKNPKTCKICGNIISFENWVLHRNALTCGDKCKRVNDNNNLKKYRLKKNNGVLIIDPKERGLMGGRPKK